jgi:hypothetical protein
LLGNGGVAGTDRERIICHRVTPGKPGSLRPAGFEYDCAQSYPIMAPLVANLMQRDIEDLAAYYSS